MFINGLRDLGSIPGRVIPKTLKMVLDTSLLNTQQYKVRIEGKVEQSRERSSTLGVVAIEKGTFWSPSTMVANFTFILINRLWYRILFPSHNFHVCGFSRQYHFLLVHRYTGIRAVHPSFAGTAESVGWEMQCHCLFGSQLVGHTHRILTPTGV